MNDSNFSDIRVLTILLQQLFKYKYIFISLFAALLLLIFYFYIESKTSEKWETLLEYSELNDIETSYLLDYSSRLIVGKNPKLYFDQKNYFDLFSEKLKIFQINYIYKYDYDSKPILEYVLENDEIYFSNFLRSLDINYYEKKIHISFTSYNIENSKKNVFYVESIVEDISQAIRSSVFNSSRLLLDEMDLELEEFKENSKNIADSNLIINDYGKIGNNLEENSLKVLEIQNKSILKNRIQKISLFKDSLKKISLLKNDEFPIKKNFIKTKKTEPSYNNNILIQGMLFSFLALLFLLILISVRRLLEK